MQRNCGTCGSARIGEMDDQARMTKKAGTILEMLAIDVVLCNSSCGPGNGMIVGSELCVQGPQCIPVSNNRICCCMCSQVRDQNSSQ